jgi:hypothetical protein
MVHVIDYVEARHKQLQTLHQKVTQEYGLYKADPFIILRAQSHLFDRKSLSQCLRQDRDSLGCWLADVEEAKRVQQEFRARAVAAAKTFFVPHQWGSIPPVTGPRGDVLIVQSGTVSFGTEMGLSEATGEDCSTRGENKHRPDASQSMTSVVDLDSMVTYSSLEREVWE